MERQANTGHLPLLGVDYYPEQWPESRWAMDARMMREAGLQVVRLAEFAWAKLQPAEGQFDWSWLDRAIETLAGEGLKLVLGTPTAAPPAWLARTHPDILPVDAEGRKRDFGSRCHYCHTSPTFRAYSQRIVERMGRHYGSHRAVIGWQIDNELGNHGSARCYCDQCVAAFRAWLRLRYGSLDALNQAWGTVFWSQVYSDWDQVNSPLRTMTEPNPSQVLDWYRFSSDATIDFARLQAETLRPLVGDRFITSNLMGLFSDVDYHKLAEVLDFVTWDNYPTGMAERSGPELYFPGARRPPLAFDAGDPYVTGLSHALMAGLKPGVPFAVMEQQCSNVNWGTFNPRPRPGTMRLWTWHSMAAGAESVVYFRWRAGLYAQEQMHGGLLRHDGEPAQGYRELLAMKDEFDLMERVRGRPGGNEVALLVSFEDLWALDLQPHNQELGYWRCVFTFYAALQRDGVPCDIVSTRANLSPYKLVIAPTLFLVDEDLAGRMADYVRDGGVLMLGPRSGCKTTSNVVMDRPLPGLLRELVGATVESWQSLPAGVGIPLALSWRTGQPAAATLWAEELRTEAAQAIAVYTEGELAGRAAATINAFGRGEMIYVGFVPDEREADALAGFLTPQSRVEPLGMVPPGVIATRRVAGDRTYFFLLNFTNSPAVALLNASELQDGFADEPVERELPIGPRDVRVLFTPIP